MLLVSSNSQYVEMESKMQGFRKNWENSYFWQPYYARDALYHEMILSFVKREVEFKFLYQCTLAQLKNSSEKK